MSELDVKQTVDNLIEQVSQSDLDPEEKIELISGFQEYLVLQGWIEEYDVEEDIMNFFQALGAAVHAMIDRNENELTIATTGIALIYGKLLDRMSI